MSDQPLPTTAAAIEAPCADDVNSKSVTIEVDVERGHIASKAREFAKHYDEGSDGRNTFIILAEWIENRVSLARTVIPQSVSADDVTPLTPVIDTQSDSLTRAQEEIKRLKDSNAFLDRMQTVRMLIIDKDSAVCVGGRFDGWRMWRHPDGQWVSIEKLKQEAPTYPATIAALRKVQS